MACPLTPLVDAVECCSVLMTAGSMPADDSRRVRPGSASSMIRRQAVSSPSELGRPLGDRVEHLADRQAVGDRLLDAEEPLEERLALLEDGDEPLVLLHVGAGPRARSARSLSSARSMRSAWASTRPMPRRSSASSESNGSPERATSERGGAVDGNGDDGAVADAGHVEDGQRADGGVRCVRRRAGRTPPAAAMHERPAGRARPGTRPRRAPRRPARRRPPRPRWLRRPVRRRRRGRPARPRRRRRRPGTRRAAGRATPTGGRVERRHSGKAELSATASTTSVWLWKPLMPWVRAISP